MRLRGGVYLESDLLSYLAKVTLKYASVHFAVYTFEAVASFDFVKYVATDTLMR